MLTVTAQGCAVVGLLTGLVGVMFVAVAAMVVDWLRYR